MQNLFKKTNISLLLSTLTAVTFAALAWQHTSLASNVLGNDEQEFLFSGRCENGAHYQLFSYQREVDGVKQWFYDYDAPLGKGSVKSDAEPKEMVWNICTESSNAYHKVGAK